MWSSPSSTWTSDLSSSDWTTSPSITPYSFSNTWTPMNVVDNTKMISPPTVPSTSTSEFVHVSSTFGWNPPAVATVNPQVVQKQQQPPRQPKKSSVIEEEISGQNLYKTELCRSYEDTGTCRYGTKCQFAHGKAELRPVLRHPKYKTEICKTFFNEGTCPYGRRCRFIHSTGPVNLKVSNNSSNNNNNTNRNQQNLPKPRIPHVSNHFEPTTTTKFFGMSTNNTSTKGFINLSSSSTPTTSWEPSSSPTTLSKSPSSSPTSSPSVNSSSTSWVEAHMSSLSISTSPPSELVQLLPDQQTEERTNRGNRLSFFESISSTK